MTTGIRATRFCRRLALCASACAGLVLCSPAFPLCNLVSDVSDAPQDDRAETHAERGLQFAKGGNLDSAESELRNAVALAPTNAEFLRDLGTVLAMEKKLEESTSLLQRALKIDAHDLAARRYVAANLWQLQRYAEARENLRVLLDAAPGDAQGLLLLGMVAENSGDYATAAKALTSVPALVRAQPESIAALAKSYYHLGETQKARAWLKELQSLRAGVPPVLLGVQIAEEMKDYEMAETLLISLQASDADQTEVNYRLALVKFHAKQFDGSRQILQRLLDEGHKTGAIERLLAACYGAQKRPDDAIQALREAIQLEPANEASYLDLGNMLMAERRLTQASELARRMANAFPESSGVLLLKGSIELAMNDYTGAVSSFTRATQLEPGNANAAIGLARAQNGAGMPEQAKAILGSAIERFPEKAAFELEMARVLLKEAETGDNAAEAKAEGLLKSAVARDDTLADAHYELGELALRRDQAAKAVPHLRKAAKLAPASARIHFALSRAYRQLGRREEAAQEASLYDKLKGEESRRAPESSPDAPSSH